MKTVVWILAIIGIVGIVAGAIDSTYFCVAIPNYPLSSRLIVMAFGAVSLIAAYGCGRKRLYGWYCGCVLIWMTLCWALFRAVYLAITLDMPWPATLLGGLGEAVKIGAFAWIFFGFWIKQKNQFKVIKTEP